MSHPSWPNAGAAGAAGPEGPQGPEGAPAVVKRTLLRKNSGQTTANPGLTDARHEVIGSYTKDQAGTVVKLTWMGTVTKATTGYCEFQIRIDGAAENGSTSTGTGFALGGSIVYGPTQTGSFFSNTSVWNSLAPGTHEMTV